MQHLTIYKIAVPALMLVNLGLIGMVVFGEDSQNDSEAARAERTLEPGMQMADDAKRPGHHRRPPHHKRHAFRRQATEILQLDTNQQAQFIELAQQHNQDMRALQEEQKLTINAWFSAVNNKAEVNAAAAEADSLLQVIQAAEAQKLQITHQHFEDVRKLLTPAQVSLYAQFRERAIDVLLFPQKKMPPPPKDF